MNSTLNAFQLFPKPNRDCLASGAASVTWLSATPSSTTTLRNILEDNHKRWHSDRGYHNYTAQWHWRRALWSLGVNESVLEAAYKTSSSIQIPAFASPRTIDSNNWKEHLGDQNYYNAYLMLFVEEIKAKDSSAVLEEYIFSENANISDEDPAMVSRFVDELIHPLIHTGYGFEFGLPGIVAEGVAMTSVHSTKSPKTIPSSLFQSGGGVKVNASKQSVHALIVLARILADSRFADGESNPFAVVVYQRTHDKHGDAVKEYVDQWTLDGPIENKVEELIWAIVVIYGVGGYKDGRPFNADFILPAESVVSRDSSPSLSSDIARVTDTSPVMPSTVPSPSPGSE
ncbi:hypothetical protein BDQ17DRAFT_1424229 [Cyathus striatus]|nr:hypothetical protein BDQ17DRAFT_1424229 [Cyathus striatus]